MNATLRKVSLPVVDCKVGIPRMLNLCNLVTLTTPMALLVFIVLLLTVVRGPTTIPPKRPDKQSSITTILSRVRYVNYPGGGWRGLLDVISFHVCLA